MAYNYFVSYDLLKEGQDYLRISAAINSLGSAVKVQKSLFYVRSNYSTVEAEQIVRKALDSNDRLIVIECANCAYFNALPPSDEFMTEHWNS